MIGFLLFYLFTFLNRLFTLGLFSQESQIFYIFRIIQAKFTENKPFYKISSVR